MIVSRSILLLVGSAAALSLTNPDQLLSDLLALEKAVQGQIVALDKFKAGISLFTSLQVTAVTVAFAGTVAQTAKSYADVLLLGEPFSEANSKRVVDQLNSTLAISDPKVCALIKSKKPQFDALFLTASVWADLNILQADHLLLSGSLTDHMAPPYTTRMKIIADITTDALRDAIAYYKPI